MDPELAGYLPSLLWAVFAGAFLLAASLGTLLAYHWFRYSMNYPVAVTASLVYAGVTFFLVSALFAATIAIIATL